ncbi:polysaccharide deacetylase family protein [Halothermothrix orenii]|uniref:Polysaccharide deacetylase n=1 Tax=Halothermothrix orenii (strain H 168 / OCM 544 / DSM 9562) TaxID=373903 RepID=B8CW83_HALOH|nr:polysaccharide deacetylase family protein [Halothermothrix orenii]ACL69552.1 polysaccharide deacetylase [Halothermothrix orenii H 168]
MNRILTLGKKSILGLGLLFFISVFTIGFFAGDKYGDVIPVLNKRLVPIYKVDRVDKKISITLDGTWGANYTEELLDIFEENDVKVTFFFAGYWLEKYPDLVKKIAVEGHDVENHTYTHPHCNSLSPEQIEDELERTSDLIEELIGKRPRFFRPPFGEYNNKVIETATGLDYQVVQWSLDSLDWQEPGVQYIVDRILNNVTSGEIVLMHNNAPHTPEALRILIPELKKRGFKIVPLSELVYKDNYYIQSHSGLQVRQKGAGDRN